MSEKEKLPWGLKPDQIAPGSIKSLSKDKLEAFDQGTLNVYVKKHLSKKEQDELRKKQEDEAAKEVLHDFVASFENSGKGLAKMFVKGAVINPSTKEEKSGVIDKGTIYKPALKLLSKPSNCVTSSPVVALPVSANLLNTNMDKEQKEQQSKKKQAEDKKKSNLELFKEELKRIQMERDERSKNRVSVKQEDLQFTEIKDINRNSKDESINPNLNHATEDSTLMLSQSSSTVLSMLNASMTGGKPNSCDDPNTTNIFISNLSPKTKEQDLMQRFGKYGPLASIKIMWPRSDEEKARNANCGFVAFMSRRDAEVALKELDGCLEHNQTMRLSWSKAITLPLQPVYIPPELIEVILPPPPSGLPFNAQPQDSSKMKQIKKKYTKKRKLKLSQLKQSSSSSRSSSASSASSSSSSSSSLSSSSSSSLSSTSSSSSSSSSKKDCSKNLENALVKVVIPTDKTLLNLIHRTIEFVIREGPAFEALLMTKEINNPLFRFMFDNQSPSHSYYRWKLYSIAHGESVSNWSTQPFKMFKNGSFWQPPPLNRYTQGSIDDSYERVRLEFEIRKGNLSNEKRSKLEEILQNLTTERKSIGEAMIFCIDNAEKSEEIIRCIVESLSIAETPLSKKIARLYLISDILHNCSVKVANASNYRRGFERYLLSVFEHISQVWMNIDGKMKSESFKQKIIGCVRAWEDWAIYPNEYLVKLQNLFLGLVGNKPKILNENSNKENNDETDDDVDGKPLEDEDCEADFTQSSQDNKEEIDITQSSKFVSSKWEQVDPEKLEKQAITTSKWDKWDENEKSTNDFMNKSEALKNLTSYDDEDGYEDEENNQKNNDQNDDDIDGKPMDEDEESDDKSLPQITNRSIETFYDEEKRKFLREIEVRIVKYVDDLESGKIERRNDLTIQEQAELYRNTILKESNSLNKNASVFCKNINSSNNNNNKNNNDTSAKSSKTINKQRSRSISSSSSSSSSSHNKSNRNRNKKRRSDSPRSRSSSYYNSNNSNNNNSSYKSNTSSRRRR